MYVEELKEVSIRNLPIEGSYIITKIEEKPFRAKGGFFLQCELTDRTGTVKAVVWDRADILKECLKNRQVFKITGDATQYNGNPQIVIKTAVKEEEFNPGDFMPSLELDVIDGYMDYLNKVKPTIKDSICQILWGSFLGSKNFRMCPGGVGDIIHHAYLGGLLEHTASMIKIAEDFCKSRPHLNRDIVLTGCLVHDIGKTLTYDWSTVIEMTDRGRLLHHTALGYYLLIGILKNPHEGTALHLTHIIMSHHQDEGIRKPMTAEAEAVAQIDSFDAATKGVQQYVDDPSNMPEDGNWTKYCHLTGRQYYAPDARERHEKKEAPVEKPKVVGKGMVEEKLF